MATNTFLISVTGSGTYLKPARVRKLIIEAWGAGGKGSDLYLAPPFANPQLFGPYIGIGGAGGAYAKKTIYYTATTQTISYSVAAPTGSGFASASVWFKPGSSTPDVVALRGNDAPVVTCTNVGGPSYICTGDSGSLASPQINFGTTVGSIGDTLFAGGNGRARGPSTTDGGHGGGGAGSLAGGTGSSANDPGPGGQQLGGSGGRVAQDLSATNRPGQPYGGGGSSAIVFGNNNELGALGGQGLLRITEDDTPLISKIEWNGNTLNFGYELDNATSYSSPIDGFETVRIENGDEYSWIPGRNYILEGDVRWIPSENSTNPTQTGWNGATGWRAFLEYARAKNSFDFYIDGTSATSIKSYLAEPIDGQHELEPDGTRKIRLVIRNNTTPYDGY